jgi:hypothetical protein
MAGTRHHTVPKFLLKGFASRTEGNKVFTWMYRKEGKPREISTKDIGVEEHFYGRKGETNADDEITLLETSLYAPLLEKLRKKSPQSGVVEVDERLLIADLISHLSTRTRNFRKSVYESTDYLIAALDNYFADFSNIENFLLKYPAQSQKHLRLKSLLGSNTNFLDSKKTKIKTSLESFFTSIKSELPRIIKESHNTTLKEMPVSKIRAAAYGQMRWFLFSYNEPSVILGDSGCLFEIAEAKNYKIFNDKKDTLKQAFLPIASNKVLIGTVSGNPKLDRKKLNQAIAKCSEGFFVYSKNSERMTKLIPVIGTESKIISQVNLEQIVIKAFRQWR